MKKSKSLIIGTLLLFLSLFEVGYALSSSTLNINGTAKISGSLDVQFSDVTTTSNATASLSSDNRILTISNVVLNNPGESATVNFKIRNMGSQDAILNSFTFTGNDDADILITFPSFQEGEVLTGLTGERDNSIVITWNPTSYVAEKTIEFSAILNYQQQL